MGFHGYYPPPTWDWIFRSNTTLATIRLYYNSSNCVIPMLQLTQLQNTYMSWHHVSNCSMLNVVSCNFTDKQKEVRKSLLQGGLVLAKDSVAPPTQRSYNSTWTKWMVFMQKCHHNPTADYIGCTQTSHDQLLQLLLMFVSYVVDIRHRLQYPASCRHFAINWPLDALVAKSRQPLTMIYWLQPKKASPADPTNQKFVCLVRMEWFNIS